jgi:hypothetical protein
VARTTVSAKANGSRRRAGGAHRSISRPASFSTSESAATRRSMPGRSTFTATRWPSSRVASCAWASEAAATGSPKVANMAPTGFPSSCSTSSRASPVGNGGNLSFRRERSSAKVRPKMSARVDRSWPSLIATGPSRSSDRANRSPGRPSRRVANTRSAEAAVRTPEE